jgi:hypothetical protein
MIQAITFPENKTIICYIYDNKKLLRAEMLEDGITVQTFAVTYDSKGRVKESIGSGRLNNQRVVYTYNHNDQVTNVDRFDQAENRVS